MIITEDITKHKSFNRKRREKSRLQTVEKVSIFMMGKSL